VIEKRYQVFVSSPYQDLKEERAEVMKALLELNCFPSGMELFPAASVSAWEIIKQVIGGCDYYLVFVGGKNGSLDETGKSYTEREFEYADELRIPILVFLHESPRDLPPSKREESDAGRAILDAFYSRLQKDRMCRFWKTGDQLADSVYRSMNAEIQRNPRSGWVRADQVPTEGQTADELRLRRRVEELEGRLEELGATAPRPTPPAEIWAEVFVVDGTFQLRRGIEDYKRQSIEICVELKSIFVAVACRLSTALEESVISRHFANWARDRVWRNINSSKRATAMRYSNSPAVTAVAGAALDKREFDVDEFVLSTDSFYAPMARLKSAGLVGVSRKPWSREAVWELTRQGEELLLQFGTADRARADAASDDQSLDDRSKSNAAL
jgi:hypothetical protein